MICEIDLIKSKSWIREWDSGFIYPNSEIFDPRLLVPGPYTISGLHIAYLLSSSTFIKKIIYENYVKIFFTRSYSCWTKRKGSLFVDSKLRRQIFFMKKLLLEPNKDYEKISVLHHHFLHFKISRRKNRDFTRTGQIV